jgi:hypothetical protein
MAPPGASALFEAFEEHPMGQPALARQEPETTVVFEPACDIRPRGASGPTTTFRGRHEMP